MCDNERNVYGEPNDKRVSHHYSVCGFVQRFIHYSGGCVVGLLTHYVAMVALRFDWCPRPFLPRFSRTVLAPINSLNTHSCVGFHLQ